MQKRTAFLVVLPCLTAGCSGQVHHGPALLENTSLTQKQIDDAKLSGTPLQTDEVGIIYYPRINIVTRTDAKGKDCKTISTFTTSTIADTTRPQRMWYSPGFLESYTFEPTLAADGTFMSFKSQSTPDRGETFKNIAEGVSSIAKTAGSLNALKDEKEGKGCTEDTKVTIFRLDPTRLPPLPVNGTSR